MRKSDKGFTLVEMLVVAPLFILVTMTMLGYLIGRYGQTVIKAKQVNLITEGQTLLITLEDELLFADDYLETLQANLVDPNEPGGGWDYDTDPDTLIISETALDGGRRDPSRDFIYSNPPTCNQIANNNLIYFIEDNAGDDYKTLYKRTITPDYATCGVNYKTTSCPEGALGTNGCTKRDGVISNNVVDFQIEYFDDDGNMVDLASGGSPLDGERLRITLLLGDIAYGEPILEEFSLSMRKLN